MNEARLAAIAMAVRRGEHQYADHADEQMIGRGITRNDLEAALLDDDTEVIEDYTLRGGDGRYYGAEPQADALCMSSSPIRRILSLSRRTGPMSGHTSGRRISGGGCGE